MIGELIDRAANKRNGEILIGSSFAENQALSIRCRSEGESIDRQTSEKLFRVLSLSLSLPLVDVIGSAV